MLEMHEWLAGSSCKMALNHNKEPENLVQHFARKVISKQTFSEMGVDIWLRQKPLGTETLLQPKN